jgi:hypothetical protein
MGETAKLSSYFSSKKQLKNLNSKQFERKNQELFEDIVFKFNFSISDEKKNQENDIIEGSVVAQEEAKKKKKKKKLKKKKKNLSASPNEIVSVVEKTIESCSLNTQKQEIPANKGSDVSFLKLCKPTGSESEVLKMQMKYGKGKLNMEAITRRRQRLKQKEEQTTKKQETASSSDSTFKFNFV